MPRPPRPDTRLIALYHQGLPYRAIAQRLGWPQGTVNRHLSRLLREGLLTHRRPRTGPMMAPDPAPSPPEDSLTDRLTALEIRLQAMEDRSAQPLFPPLPGGPDRGPYVRTKVYLSQPMLDALDTEAEARGLDRSKLVRLALREWLAG